MCYNVTATSGPVPGLCCCPESCSSPVHGHSHSGNYLTGLQVAAVLQVLRRSPGNLVLDDRGVVIVLHQSPSLWVASVLRIIHQSQGGLLADSTEEVRWEEVVEVVREVREVVGWRPSQPAANPATYTISRPGPTQPTVGQAHSRHCPYQPAPVCFRPTRPPARPRPAQSP